MVSEDLLNVIGLYSSWVEFPFISYSVYPLQLESPSNYKIYPFKFNLQWLTEEGFVELVFKVWNDQMFMTESGKQQGSFGN
jgi:hypothetical protein